MSSFPTNRSLLNPKFEGYKLAPLQQDELVLRYPLTAYPTQANVSGRSRTPLSFEEVQSRITHNHLAVSRDGRSIVYVDNDLNVIQVTLNPDLTPTFSTLSELPKPIQSDEAVASQHKEYPSSVSLKGFWVVSDGTGLLYVLSEERIEDRIAATYYLPDDNNPSDYAPFRLHYAHLKEPGTAICVLSCRHLNKSDGSETAKKGTKPGETQFDVLLAEVPLSTRTDETQALKVVWRARGDDVPTHIGYDASRSAFFVLGKSSYRGIGVAAPPIYEPAADELAPIPRAGEALPDSRTKPPPYSWKQTPDSVTVAFALPSTVPKSAIHVTLTAKTLSLLVKHELPTSAPLPRYSLKELWDSINPGTSFWTWDRAADREFGLLTLHLDKQHDGVRWAQVFASAARSAAVERADATDEEVPETLDPSELYAIREALEKYTSALQRGDDPSGLGLGTGVPSLAEGELDEAVDTSVGRSVVITWVGVDGKAPAWAAKDDSSSSLLSVPVPGLEEAAPSLVVRSDIDGLLFSLPSAEEASPSPTAWKHISTYPALAFVLASKRDTRFTFHISSSVVLAFESGASTGGGNVYIYCGLKPGSKATSAKQSVLKLSGGTSGALLGVGTMKKEDSGHVLVCLCEKELVVIKDIV